MADIFGHKHKRKDIVTSGMTGMVECAIFSFQGICYRSVLFLSMKY